MATCEVGQRRVRILQRVGATTSSSRAYVCCLPSRPPLVMRQSSSATMKMYASRGPSGASIPAETGAFGDVYAFGAPRGLCFLEDARRCASSTSTPRRGGNRSGPSRAAL